MATVRTYSRFDELPPSYAGLFREAGSRSFFLSRTWFENFASTAIDQSQQVVLYGLESDDGEKTPLALLPMRHDSRSGLLEGRHLKGLSSYYTPLFGPLTTAGHGDPSTLLRELAGGIAAERPRWHTVDLQPLDLTSRGFSSLVTALKSVGLLVQTYFCFGNWYLEVGGRSYEEYTESLPSRLRNTIRRKSRKLERAGDLRIEIVTSQDGLDTAITAYETVYRASWKVPEPYPGFVPGLIRACARDGSLRLGLVYLDDVPIAAQLWIVTEGTASIFKLAYDEAHAKLSAGSVLSAHLFRHAIDVDGVAVVDYLSGDDSYKSSWMSHRRERWGIVAFNPRTLRGAAQAVANIGGRALKKAWQRVRPDTE